MFALIRSRLSGTAGYNYRTFRFPFVLLLLYSAHLKRLSKGTQLALSPDADVVEEGIDIIVLIITRITHLFPTLWKKIKKVQQRKPTRKVTSFIALHTALQTHIHSQNSRNLPDGGKVNN